MLDSAQVRLAHAGRVWVLAGDDFLGGHAGDRNDEAVMVRWLRQQGLQAGRFSTTFGGGDDDAVAGT